MIGDVNLVRMANRIGEFFEAEPRRERALEGIAQHIARYWEPRMRRRIFVLIDCRLAPDLTSIVTDALRSHREVLLPAELDPLPIPPTGESEA